MQDYSILILRTILGYTLLFLLMKLMGKREIGQLSLFDLIIILSIADLMVLGIDEYRSDIFLSFIPMILVAVIQKIVATISLRSLKFRTLIDGKESYIIIDGKLNLNEMKKQRYNMNDLYAQLREQEIKAIEEVDYAILEASGKLSVFKNKKEMDISFPIIISGKVNHKLLKYYGYDINWLNEELYRNNKMLKEVLAASISNKKLKIVEIYEG